MREILFRGKRADTGDWVKGFYIQKPNPFSEDGKPIRHCIVDLPPFGYDVDPETVGQFTGLLDKNGTKIFEGDILSDPEYPKYTTGAIYYGSCNCSCCGGVYGFYSEENADLRNADSLTVIGNVYDNPELLKGGDKDG